MPSMPGFTVSYAKVEAALVRMHGIAQDDFSAFRSRFGALQRGGLLGAESQPGKGKKLEYGPDQFHRARLAFELVQCGIAPGVFLPLIEEYWDSKLRDIFMMAERAIVRKTSDVVLILAGVAALNPETPVPNINHTTMDKISERMRLLDGEGLPARACGGEPERAVAQVSRCPRALSFAAGASGRGDQTKATPGKAMRSG